MKPANPEDKQLFLSTSPGLEPSLVAEARERGWHVEPTEGGAECNAPNGAHQEACLWLRSAHHVLLRLASFRAVSASQLERELRGVSLGPYVSPKDSLSLSISASRSKLSASAAHRVAQSCWKVSEGKDTVAQLKLRLEQDVCTVSIDCSGEILHKRGYRQENSQAPLRETLAAAILRFAGYDTQKPLWDLMCGSGTFLIEAAWLSMDRAPGLNRSFAFERWPSFQAPLWKQRCEEARKGERPRPASLIIGTDLNAGALGVARRNARRAGVGEFLRLERSDVAQAAPSEDMAPGLVLANLPYGNRIGERSSLSELYRKVGSCVGARFGGWRFSLLVPDDEGLLSALGLRFEATHTLSNGGIRCRLLLGGSQ